MEGIDYFGECCDKFDKMPMRGEIDIEKQVKPENKENFIQTATLFMELDWGRKNGYYLQPNNAWTKIIKTSYPPSMAPQANADPINDDLPKCLPDIAEEI